jgi:flagellar hook-associated protein 1 FlgK
MIFQLDINMLLSHIASTNEKIASIEIHQGETGDLRDQRDLDIKKLSEYLIKKTK